MEIFPKIKNKRSGKPLKEPAKEAV